MSYEKELAFAKDLAQQAGALMVEGMGRARTEWKADNTPVTSVDIAINKLVIEAVQKAFPDDGVLGEENSYEPQKNRKWVVDPIDGTQAYDLGAPVATHCNGLVVDDEAILGVVYDPFLNNMFTAVKGHGAFLNGKPISASQISTLDKSYVILSSRMGANGLSTGQISDKFAEVGSKYFNFRSIVYGYMLVARGASVASVSGTLRPWDLAAAKVILEEAGATITDLAGNNINWNQTENGVLVTNGLVHNQVLNLLKQ